MRNIILLLLFPVFLSAQSVVLKDSFPVYQGVISFDNKSIDEIHTLLKKNNTVILSTIKLDEKDKIICTSIQNYSYSQKVANTSVNIGGVINYILTLDIKEGKIRYSIEINDVRAGLVSMFGLLKEKPKDIVSAPIMVEVIKFKNELIQRLSLIPKDNW